MKTFFERFLDEVTRKLEAGEIDEEKARLWITELQEQLQNYAEQHPHAPIVRMPVKH
jgi:cell division septum initiation protein DivIVA